MTWVEWVDGKGVKNVSERGLSRSELLVARSEMKGCRSMGAWREAYNE